MISNQDLSIQGKFELLLLVFRESDSLYHI